MSLWKRLFDLSRRLAALSLAAILGGAAPAAALAQEGREGIVARPAVAQSRPADAPQSGAMPAQSTSQTPPGDSGQNPITQPLALSPEVSRQRVGVNLDQVQLLSLQDAIAMALQNNLDIEASRQGVQIAQFNLFAARGIYDIVSGAEVGYRSATTPIANVFAGGGQLSSITEKTLAYDFFTNQNIEATGGNYEFSFNNNRRATTSTVSTLTPQYNTSFTATFTQPLMRNLSIDQNRRQIHVLQRQLDLSDSQFRQRVIEIIASVQRAYWDLVFAIRNEQIARNTVEVTRVQLENNRKQVEAGTLAPIELRSTEAALEQRKGEVIVALQNITTAENTLKGLLLKDSGDKMWTAVLQPTDEPQFGQTPYAVDEAVSLALRNRPELDQLRLEAEAKQIDIDFFRNQTKPQVDLFAIYGSTGLAGTEQLALGPDGTPLPSRVPPQLQGGYWQSLSNLFGQDFRNWQVGVRLSFPWRNRTAEGNLGRALAESRQIDARTRRQVQDIQIEVRNALQAVEAARQRFEAARANRIAAEAQLAGEQEKFRAGLSTNYFVLERQNDLAVAQGDEVRALTDYNKALADLQRVTGLTLVTNNVQVEARPAQR